VSSELFFSLKNAFSKLELDEKGTGEKKQYNFKQSEQPHQFGISDHKAIAQRIQSNSTIVIATLHLPFLNNHMSALLLLTQI
jgi:hypothetical protein